jgi:glucosyl-3-phosphoglycerate phosphatase
MASKIYLIRHGQSTFNALYEIDGVDPMHFDARLSPLGHRQVAEARRATSELRVDLVVVSPLTRAIQTALGLFEGSPPPIIVNDLLRERLHCSCDVGRSPPDLKAEFPQLSFDHLDHAWWLHDKDNRPGIVVEPEDRLARRLGEFSTWITGRPEVSIAVVGHGEFFRRLAGRYLANCEIAEWAFAPSTPAASTEAP